MRRILFIVVSIATVIWLSTSLVDGSLSLSTAGWPDLALFESHGATLAALGIGFLGLSLAVLLVTARRKRKEQMAFDDALRTVRAAKKRQNANPMTSARQHGLTDANMSIDEVRLSTDADECWKEAQPKQEFPLPSVVPQLTENVTAALNSGRLHSNRTKAFRTEVTDRLSYTPAFDLMSGEAVEYDVNRIVSRGGVMQHVRSVPKSDAANAVEFEHALIADCALDLRRYLERAQMIDQFTLNLQITGATLFDQRALSEVSSLFQAQPAIRDRIRLTIPATSLFVDPLGALDVLKSLHPVGIRFAVSFDGDVLSPPDPSFSGVFEASSITMDTLRAETQNARSVLAIRDALLRWTDDSNIHVSDVVSDADMISVLEIEATSAAGPFFGRPVSIVEKRAELTQMDNLHVLRANERR
ncbi:MAG: hypothetical protein AAGI92_09610 [Pseudomonadota bacterium]